MLKVAFKKSFISTYAFSGTRSSVGETGRIRSSSYCDKWLFGILKVYLMTPRCRADIPHAALNTTLTLWTQGFLERIPLHVKSIFSVKTVSQNDILCGNHV